MHEVRQGAQGASLMAPGKSGLHVRGEGGHESDNTLEDGEGREAWHGAVHRVAKSWTQLSDWTTKEGRFFSLR